MAKYQVTYRCGHTGTVDLFGPSKQRENKLEWLSTQLCPDCWKEEQAQQAHTKPIIVNTSIFNTMVDGKIFVIIELGGETYSRKEDLKKLGFSWGQTFIGDKSWHKYIPFEDFLEDKQILQDNINAIKNIAPVKEGMSITNEDIKRNLNYLKQIEDIKLAIKEIPKPKKPDFLNGKWNGKMYAKNTIYVDGNAIRLTDEQVQELNQYIKDKESYDKKVSKLVGGESSEFLKKYAIHW